MNPEERDDSPPENEEKEEMSDRSSERGGEPESSQDEGEGGGSATPVTIDPFEKLKEKLFQKEEGKEMPASLLFESEKGVGSIPEEDEELRIAPLLEGEDPEFKMLGDMADRAQREMLEGLEQQVAFPTGIEHLAETIPESMKDLPPELAAADVPPYDMGTFGRLEEFTSPPKGYVEVERYWIERPFSYVVILREEGTGHLRYHVVEPKLSFEEERLRWTLWGELKDKLPYEVSGVRQEEILAKEMVGMMKRLGITDLKTIYRIFYILRRDNLGFGKIDALLKDPMIEDISCDGPEVPIFIYHRRYYNMETNIQFGADELDSFNSLLAERSGKHISFAEPVIDARLPDGSRVQATFGSEVTARGASFTIRKWLGKVFTPVDLIRFHTFSPEMLAYLWLAIEYGSSVMVIGGTASGKTSTLNALAFFIPPDAKIISIEDTRELSLYQQNWVPNVTREAIGSRPIDMNELVKIAMRQRPECLIVGEVRGVEAQAMFQAICTGHTAFCTMHAGSVQAAVNRLEGDPINLPRPMLAELDIVCLQLLTNLGSERVRRNLQITEFAGLDPITEDIRVVDTFRWDPPTDSFRKVEESWVLREVRKRSGMNPIQLRKELKNRERVLQHMADKAWITPAEIASMFRQYYYNPQSVIEKIEAG